METKIYQKESNLNLYGLLKDSLSDIYGSRSLSRQWAVRDIRGQYRQSYFGIIWAFITPLATAFVWIILNQSGIIALSDTGVPYPVYAFTGTLIWSVLIDAINAPTINTNNARTVLSKINFPKEALIVSGVYKLLFSSFIKLILILVFLVAFGIPFQSYMLLFPLALIGVIFFGTTIGLVLTPIGLLYNDIARIISLTMRFLMYATPVVYAVPDSGLVKRVMEINPLTPLITVTRDLLTAGSFQYLQYFFWILLISVPLFLTALLFYRISIPVIVERMHA